MKTKPHNVGLKLKDMKISLDSTVIRKPLPKDKHKWPGLKKGSGGLPDGGPIGASGEGAAESVAFPKSLILMAEEAAALQDITDEQPVEAKSPDQPAGEEPAQQPAPGSAPIPAGEATDEPVARYVKGAHLVYKREIEAGQFEELWIYSIDPNTSDPQTNTPLKAIIAGTDIPENGTRSEDGTQSYALWTAGNAQFVHIKGLPN